MDHHTLAFALELEVPETLVGQPQQAIPAGAQPQVPLAVFEDTSSLVGEAIRLPPTPHVATRRYPREALIEGSNPNIALAVFVQAPHAARTLRQSYASNNGAAPEFAKFFSQQQPQAPVTGRRTSQRVVGHVERWEHANPPIRL